MHRPCAPRSGASGRVRPSIHEGRFGQIVFADPPTPEDPGATFRVHIAERVRDPPAFELAELAVAGGCSGAAVEAALPDAFMDGEREVAPAGVVRRMRSIRPTNEVKRDEIEALPEWARPPHDRRRARPAAARGERLLEC